MSLLHRSREAGFEFHAGEDELERRLANVRALLFDWDGVFNDGSKDLDGGSPFSEVDSMGVNLLRFALWSRDAALPVAAVITGQHNAYAERFAVREHLHAVHMGFTDKSVAFDAFLEGHGLRADQVCFVFDDVLDLPVAMRCGLRLLIGHRATHHFQHTVRERRAADITVPLGGAHHGLRQACELLIAMTGSWDAVIDHRMNYSKDYQAYLAARNAVVTQVVRNDR